MPAIYHEGSWLGNATDPEVLVKDTVGWTGKNRAYSQTNNAVIAHIENGITYDVSWTGSATVTLKKNSTSGATITSGSTSPLSFTADADYELYFGSSATVTNIMVKDSRITDPTYEPYHESVEVMYEEEIHGVNLLKNEATTQTVSGVTFTVNSDGTITANGTATSDIIEAIGIFNYVPESLTLTGCPSNGAWNTYRLDIRNENNIQYGNYLDTGNGVTFTPSENYTYVCLRIGNGTTVSNIVFKPMLRKADIDDPTYRPYNYQAIQNQLNAQGVLGAKNLLENKTTDQTVLAVAYTVNNDVDSLNYKTIDVNGTATNGNSIINVNTYTASEFNKLNSKDLILSGCPKGGSGGTYRIDIKSDTETMKNLEDWGNGVRIPANWFSAGTIKVRIGIASGTVANHLLFKPMLRLASDPDDTYQPYAMTNRELTEKVAIEESGEFTGTVSTNNATITYTRFVRSGRVCFAHIRITLTADIEADGRITIENTSLPVYRGNSGSMFSPVYRVPNMIAWAERINGKTRISFLNAVGAPTVQNGKMMQASFCYPIE
ncbi:MAG: hypothetical protein IIY21_24165 [Clostridiales bacterium]|nr:hypothetical protein [Clostridiales bacterium]